MTARHDAPGSRAPGAPPAAARPASRAVARTLRGWPLALVAFACILAGIWIMFRTLPSSFVPEEDQGYFFTAIVAPDTANLEVTAAITRRVQEIVSADPAVSCSPR